MAIPSRPIGQDPISQQLWYISKQLERLAGILSTRIVTTTTSTTTTGIPIPLNAITTKDGMEYVKTISGEYITT